MKISENSLQILKNFSQFNKSILIRQGNVISTIHKDKNFFARATVEETFPVEFAIYELYDFIGVISIFEQPDYDFQDKMVYISEGKSKIRYRYTDSSMILSAPAKKIELPDVAFEFELKKSDLQSLSKSLSILDLPEFVLQGDGENVTLFTANSRDMESDQFQISVGQSEHEFRYFFPRDYVNLIMKDYTVKVSSVGLVEFHSDNLSYYIMGTKKG